MKAPEPRKQFHIGRFLWANEDPPYDPYLVPCFECGAKPSEGCEFPEDTDFSEKEKTA